jgi:hypothetical protein
VSLFSNTPFDVQGEQGTSPFLRATIAGGVATGIFVGHKKLLANNEKYSRTLYNFFRNLEDKSPGRVFSTFGLSEMMSSYTIGDIHIHRTSLVDRGGLTPLGSHVQRLLGNRVDVLRQSDAGLTFRRVSRSDPYHQLVTDLGGTEKNIRMRFTERGRLSASSFRYNAPIRTSPKEPLTSSTTFGRIKERFKRAYRAQQPHGYAGFVGEIIEDPTAIGATSRMFQPWMSEFTDDAAESFKGKASRIAFELFERPQRLLADVGLGLKSGTYNSVWNIPFMPSGKKGILNNILTKRVLPIYLAGLVALPYLDYKLDHSPSNTVIDSLQALNLGRAKLTDKLPGARKVTDLYEDIVPGPQYGPLALPIGGAFAGGLYHFGKVLLDKYPHYSARVAGSRILAQEGDQTLFRFFNKSSPVAKGLIAGLALMLPFIPGMIGSRKTEEELKEIYSGEELVPIRAGRWWDLGTTPFEGSRIKEWRPHWSVLWKSQAEKKSLYGSEEEYWKHHPILHPISYLEDPYYLEKLHYQDRPYPISSPAFSNVPLIGPLLAATIGKIVKPPLMMHVGEWDPENYSLYSTRLEPRGPDALPPPTPKAEFSLWDAAAQEPGIMSEFIGLPGFIASTVYGKIIPDTDKGKTTYLEGSRQMDSFSRKYYDLELGAGMFASPKGDASLTGYTEPFRRFVQREQGLADVNEIANSMPWWLPGDDYFVNFKVGDPYTKVSNGYARLPGPGYEALHPETAGMDYDDYPDINRLAILGDVAPYSKEFQATKGKVAKIAASDTAIRIQYERILERNEKMRRSVVDTDQRRFSEPVETTSGTISKASGSTFELSEYPGRSFSLSAVGMSASDLSSLVLAENNELSKSEVVSEVERRQARKEKFLEESLELGSRIQVTVPKGSLAHALSINAVVQRDGSLINQQLIDQGLGVFRKDLAGSEVQAMFGPIARKFGALAESLSFTGDESPLNPLRYIPQPFNTKLWQEREPISQYREQEVSGARMRRWQRPIHDFLSAYGRGTIHRLTGQTIIPDDVQHRRDLNTTVDMLEYLRALVLTTDHPESRGRYTSQARRTAVGSDLFGSPTWIGSTLPEREAHYFHRFLSETDVEKRKKILDVVPEETARALTAQWTKQEETIAEAEGRKPSPIGEGGRLFTPEDLEKYKKAKTKLDYGDYMRSMEVANFFSSRGLNLPETSSQLWDQNLDYEDVKLKILLLEGYDAHDFNIFDDRVALLWRKPYVDGAVRELTAGGNGSVEQMRQSVEQIILASKDKSQKVIAAGSPSHIGQNNLRFDIEIDQQQSLLQDMRRNPEKYQ